MGLDAVEIVMLWEETFGIRIEDSEAFNLTTPRQAIDLISAKLDALAAPSFCPGLRAFNVFRRAVGRASGGRLKKLRLRDRLRDLEQGDSKRRFWSSFRDASGIKDFKPPQVLFRRATVRDAIELIMARHLRALLRPGERWTRQLVRCGVRYAVVDVVGARQFSDDDHFIKDIGVD